VEVLLMLHTYKVVIETDNETGKIVVSLPTLNYTADFGDTVEEAIANLKKLAIGFIETLRQERIAVPPNDPLTGNDLFLTLEIHDLAEVA